MDDFEGNQLVVVCIAASNEEERGVAAVNNLGI